MKVDVERKMAALIARCWMDPEFRKRFLAEPKAVIAEALLDLPPEGELVIVEDTKNKRHLILPEAPPAGFTKADLDHAAERLLHPETALYCDRPPATESVPQTIAATAALYCREEFEVPAAPYCRPLEKEGSGLVIKASAALYCHPDDDPIKSA